MKRAALAAALFSLSFATPAFAQQLKDGVIEAVQIEAVITVLVVDPKARQVVVRGPRGGVATLNVPKNAQNLDQVKQGSQFKVKYVEAIALSIRKGGKPSAMAGEEIKLAPKGGTPGGIAVRTAQIAGVVEAVDYTNRYIALRGPKSNVVSLKVADDVKLEELNAGDRIALTYVQALAMEMIPTGPAKKAPAKKDGAKKAG
jgi:hypothetical protein